MTHTNIPKPAADGRAASDPGTALEETKRQLARQNADLAAATQLLSENPGAAFDVDLTLLEELGEVTEHNVSIMPIVPVGFRC